jgi:hypothetical protein
MRGSIVRGVAGLVGAFVVAVGCCGALAAPIAAAAVIAAPAWSLHSLTTPSDFSASQNTECSNPGQAEPARVCDHFTVAAVDVGARPSDGTPITLTDTLPDGVTVKGVEFYWEGPGAEAFGVRGSNLGGICETEPVVRCEFPLAVQPGDSLEMYVYVTVDEPVVAGSLTNSATVSGGGTASVSTSSQNPVGGGTPPFGVEGFSTSIDGQDGKSDSQAGDHPYEMNTLIDLNSALRVAPDGGSGSRSFTGIEDLKDVVVDLPVGLVGSVLAAPQCTLTELAQPPPSGATNTGKSGGCPPDTVIGHLRTNQQGDVSATGVDGSLYNLVPQKGVAAEFGFLDQSGVPHALVASVAPTPAGYVLRTASREIAQITMHQILVTIFGNPAASDQSSLTPQALFTNPSACTGEPLVTRVYMDSWQHPGSFNADGSPNLADPSWASATSSSPAVTGCNLLQFSPSLTARPDTTAADSPSGLSVDIGVPQTEDPETLATPPLRNASVTLPAGLSIDPSSADGLQACSPAQIGLGSALAPACPSASQVGTVEVQSPLLAGTLSGEIYLATPYENPFGSLFAAYVVVDDPVTGVVLKVPGMLRLDPVSGQVTGVFDGSPQFPFSDLKLDFKGGPRGVLATPASCGSYTTVSDLSPWSAPDSGADATPFDSFQVLSGCGGGFAPGFTAGTEDPQAGAYAPFALSISRQDGEQDLSGVSVTLPPGSLGKIAGIPLCPAANAGAGTCPEASRVGSASAGAGVGPDPYFVGGGVYLTGPYNGGPFGLVEEVPAVAGPFNLGMVVVRQSIRIDPHTAQVSAVSDPLPTILGGVPLQVRRVDVVLNRPGFTFNPTSCAPMAVTGALSSTAGTTTAVSDRFQVANCAALSFKPSFTVSTQAKTSKKQGASLDVRVGYPKGAQANIHSVAVTLPRQLPARLTTIQQACLAAVFAVNPAGCPVGSNIGTATASTPVLANPVVGPAYLVSHGGAAFPGLVIVLQGEGVMLDLVGSIDIKHGVTSSTFAGVPDAPISSFELKLPEGPHSGLAAVVPAKAKGGLCGVALKMPTTLTGQNGAVVKQSTKIAVTGCAKAKKKHRARSRKHPKAKAKGKK